MSNDRTRPILKDYTEKYSFIKIFDNPKKVTPVAMNVGIKAACGDYILILSSHSQIDPKFVERNIENILKNDADCIGGVMLTLPANYTILAQSIAFALSHYIIDVNDVVAQDEHIYDWVLHSDGKIKTDADLTSAYKKLGTEDRYQFIKDVKKSEIKGGWFAEWKTDDEKGFRIFILCPEGAEVLIGEAPQSRVKGIADYGRVKVYQMAK